MQGATAYRNRETVQLPESRRRGRAVDVYVTAGLVALAYLALALLDGGYGVRVYAAGGLIVWWAVLVGLASGVFPHGPVPPAALAVGTSLALLVGFTALSATWSNDNGSTAAEAVRAAAYLGLLVLVIVASGPGRGRVWLAGLATGLTALAALAVGSRMLPSLFPETELAELLSSASTRLSYPLNYWNGLGATLAAAAVLLVWFGTNAARAAVRACATAALPLPLLGLFLTSSRGGVVALVAGLALLIAVGPARVELAGSALVGAAGAGVLVLLALSRDAFLDGRQGAQAVSEGTTMLAAGVAVMAVLWLTRLALDTPLRRARIGAGTRKALAAGAAAAAVVALVNLDPAQRIDDFKRPPGPVDTGDRFIARHLVGGEGNGRYQFWSSALDALGDRPLGGLGAGGFEAWWTRDAPIPYHVRDAHSLVFETGAELGLIGLGLLAAFVGSAAMAARARWRDGPDRPAAAVCAAIGTCGAVSAAIDWTWELPAAFVPALLCVGLLVGPALARAHAPARRNYGWGVVTLAAACVGVAASGVMLAGEAKLRASQAAAREGDLAGAANDARDARALLPWSARPPLQLALVREREGRLGAAGQDVDAALERAPEAWRSWLVAARVRTRLGDFDGAATALLRALWLNPRSPLLPELKRDRLRTSGQGN